MSAKKRKGADEKVSPLVRGGWWGGVGGFLQKREPQEGRGNRGAEKKRVTQRKRCMCKQRGMKFRATHKKERWAVIGARKAGFEGKEGEKACLLIVRGKNNLTVK